MSTSLYSKVLHVPALQLLPPGRATPAKGMRSTCFPGNVPDDRGLKWSVLEKRRCGDLLQKVSDSDSPPLCPPAVSFGTGMRWAPTLSGILLWYNKQSSSAVRAGRSPACLTRYNWPQLFVALLGSVICSSFSTQKCHWEKKKINRGVKRMPENLLHRLSTCSSSGRQTPRRSCCS